MKSNDPTNFTVPRELFAKYLSIKYEIVYLGLSFALVLFAKSQKKREAIKKRESRNMASEQQPRQLCAIVETCAQKRAFTQCLKEMLQLIKEQIEGNCNGYTNFDAVKGKRKEKALDF